jgi:hypothetical protein
MKKKKFYVTWKCRDNISGCNAEAVAVCQLPDWKLYLDNVNSRRGK